MAKLLRVRILEPWRGYNINSVVTMTEKAYFTHKAKGVKLSLLSDTVPTQPTYQTRPLDVDRLHDRPFHVDDESEEEE